MDANKLQALQELGYAIQQVCGTCKYARLKPTSDFGTCTFHHYVHGKHTGGERQLSINRYGCCDDHDVAPAAMERLESFVQFAANPTPR